VDRCGFAGGCRSVKRFVRKLRGRQFAGSLRRERDGDPRRDPSRLRHRAHVSRSAQGGQVPAYEVVRADAQLQPQVGVPERVPLQFTDPGQVILEMLRNMS
jgi:hypothetical protein